MPINDPVSSQTAARTPRLRVLTGGQQLPGIISASATQNNAYQCAKFRLEFAASAQKSGWWDVEPPLVLDIQVSLDGFGWTSLIIGEVDDIDANLQSGLIDMEGRDLSAPLIEAKTQETFQNQTSSEVATIIAGRHNLTAQVTSTSTPIGRYYQADHVHTSQGQFSRQMTEWDLLVYLAQMEGFDVFVQGTTLYFQPATAPDADPYVIQWTPPTPLPRLNAVTLHMKRSLTIAKDIEVWVRSWNSNQAKGFTKKVKGSGTKSASASGITPGPAKQSTTTQRYVFVRPNLTEDQALKFAQSMLTELTKHERIIDVDIPGELSLTPRNMVRIQGTGTSFDQSYYIQTIERSISFSEGFRQQLRLKNTSPRSQTEPL